MGRGGRRAGAGRKRKPIRELLLTGRYRADRHGARPAPGSNVLTMPAAGVDWWPAPADVDALAPHARSLLDATLSLYRLSAIEGEQVLLALRTLSRCEQLEAAIAELGITDGSGKPLPLLSALSRESRAFLSLWQAIQFERT